MYVRFILDMGSDLDSMDNFMNLFLDLHIKFYV